MFISVSKYPILVGLGILTFGMIGATQLQAQTETRQGGANAIKLIINAEKVFQADSRQDGADAIKLIINAEQAYHLEHNTFASKVDQLGIQLQPKNYRFALITDGIHYAIAKAIPTQKGLRSYAGGMLQKGEQFSAIVCESNHPSSSIAQPYLKNDAWVCGPDSHPFDGSATALSSMGVIARAQQAYRLENNTFATKISQLDARLELTAYYRYGIVEAGTNHAIAKAIPTVSGLKSVAGAALQRGDRFIQIICESNRPSQTIALPYLSQGAWVCGADSHIVPEHSIK